MEPLFLARKEEESERPSRKTVGLMRLRRCHAVRMGRQHSGTEGRARSPDRAAQPNRCCRVNRPITADAALAPCLQSRLVKALIERAAGIDRGKELGGASASAPTRPLPSPPLPGPGRSVARANGQSREPRRGRRSAGRRPDLDGPLARATIRPVVAGARTAGRDQPQQFGSRGQRRRGRDLWRARSAAEPASGANVTWEVGCAPL